MRHGIRIAKPVPERFANRYFGDRRGVDRIHHHQPVDMDRIAVRPFADA